MKCPYCEKEMSDTLNFCINCGKPIPHCQECGKPILFRTSTCVKCGTSIPLMLIAELPDAKMEERELIDEAKRKREREQKEKERKIATQKRLEEITKLNHDNSNQIADIKKKKVFPAMIVSFVILIIAILIVLPKIRGNDDSQSTSAVDTNTEENVIDAEDNSDDVEVMGTYINIVPEEFIVYIPGHGVTLEMDTDVSNISKIQWFIEDSSIAQVDSNGLITGNKEGTTRVVASWNGVEDSCLLQCVPADPSDYILPYSNQMYVTKEELSELSNEELRLAYNEIYARHGIRFKDEQFRAYFVSKSWYDEQIDAKEFDESALNIYEKENAEVITDYSMYRRKSPFYND